MQKNSKKIKFFGLVALVYVTERYGLKEELGLGLHLDPHHGSRKNIFKHDKYLNK